MNYSIIPTANFIREAKKLSKKHHSIKNDLLKLRTLLESDPFQGVALSDSLFKIRMAITSKGKGKAGGARIISYVFVTEKQAFLISIYDKSRKENVTDEEIRTFLRQLPFKVE